MASTINASSTGSGGLITTGDASGQLALQANGVTQATVSSTGLAMATNQTFNTANTFGFKNVLINGQFQFSQYNGTTSTTPVTNSYIIDRWAVTMGAAGKFTQQQVADAPAGFYNSLKMTTSSAYSTVTYFDVYQRIEGYNWNYMAWGTSSAKPVTVSAWVKSSVTGTYTGFIRSNDQGLDVSFSYSIPTANTWTYITATIAGQTTGNWGGTTGIGASLYFDFPNIIPTLNATWQITGVQLELGSQATSFDFRSYGTELALCQRYFQTWGGNSIYERIATGYAVSSTQMEVFIPRYYAPMRSAPSLSVNSASNFRASDGGGSYTATAVAISQASPLSCGIQVTVASGLTLYRAMSMDTNNTTSALLSLSAEL